MKIELHAEAVRRYTERINELLIRLIPKPSNKEKKIPFDSGLVTKEIMTEEIINLGFSSEEDCTGKKTSMFFKFKDHFYGLSGEDFKDFVRLCEDIQKSSNLNEYASIEFLSKTLFNWMQLRYCNQTIDNALDYLILKCEEEIKAYEVWVPIANTIVQSEFQIGDIVIKNLSKEILDTWEQGLLGSAKNDKQILSIKKYIKNEREKKQGFAIAIYKANAEKIRAEELAFEKIEQALSILRIFSPAAIFSNQRTYTTVKGMENLQSRECFFVQDNYMHTQNVSMLFHNYTDWIITDEQIIVMQKNGLIILDELLKNRNRNQFQDKVLNSFILFSQGTLTNNVHEKLIYIFVALESIVLKNETEPITQNISDRIAFAIAKQGQSRMQIIKNIKGAYNFRSRFVHHGVKIDEIIILDEFVRFALSFLMSLLFNINKFKTKEDMIAALDKMKYGA